MSDQPEILKVSVAEDINTKDVPPGTQPPSMKEIEENLPKEEIEKRQKIMLEYSRLSARYCEPHALKSRWITAADLPRVLSDGRDLVAMCNLPRGHYSGIAALAHPQIENKDPLRFFVLPTGMVIINPVIFGHTKVPVFKNEGCMSFPDHPVKMDISRYNKVRVMYQTLQKISEDSDPILSAPVTEDLSSGPAHVFQHEISHLNGVNIYDETYTAESCEGLGSGPLTEEQAKALYEQEKTT